MIYHKTGLIILAMIVILSPAYSQTGDIELSGFADVQYLGHEGTTVDRFANGQMELGIATPVSEEINFEVAIAYDQDAETFGIGAMLIDYNLKSAGLFSSDRVYDAGIIVGQFDVPFGIDLNYYPSIERKLISGPLTVGMTHDYWNDVGAQIYLNISRFGITMFGVNGFGHEFGFDGNGNLIGYNGIGYDPEDSSVNSIESECIGALGGRLAWFMNVNFEFGTSYAACLDKDNEIGTQLIGFDAQYRYRRLFLKSEFIVDKVNNRFSSEEILNKGYYAQGLYEFSKLFLVARYSGYELDIAGVENMNQTSVGIGWKIRDFAELRYEYQIVSDETDMMMAQFVVGF